MVGASRKDHEMGMGTPTLCWASGTSNGQVWGRDWDSLGHNLYVFSRIFLAAVFTPDTGQGGSRERL